MNTKDSGNFNKVLFVNGCMRAKGVSRTYALANRFLNAYKKQNPKDEIIHLELCTERFFPLTYYDLNMQEKSIWVKSHYAQQFERSDKIIFAAPVWNLGCPSVLNIYIEHICLPGTTCQLADNDYVGLCSGKKVLYISTVGGSLPPETTVGIEYIQSVMAMLGIDDFQHIYAKGMDIADNDAEMILNNAMKKCDVLAKTW